MAFHRHLTGFYATIWYSMGMSHLKIWYLFLFLGVHDSLNKEIERLVTFIPGPGVQTNNIVRKQEDFFPVQTTPVLLWSSGPEVIKLFFMLN